MKKRHAVFFSFLMAFTCSLSGLGYATFLGTVKTGLQAFGTESNAYSVYVPNDYSPDRSWPLVIALHQEGSTGEKYIQTWISEATRRGFIVLSPTYERVQENPELHDKRILKLKQDLQKMYEIDPDRILIAGYGSGGHYALYLSLRYPEEFSAVASVGNGFEGRLQQLFRFPYAHINRLPILILAGGGEPVDQDVLQQNVKHFQEKGFLVDTVPAESIKTQEDPSASPFIMNWFDEALSKRQQEASKKTGKVNQKFYEWLDSVF